MSAETSSDRKAHFRALALPHLDRLLAFARRRCDGEALAEDLVQDAYLRAWRRFDTLEDERRVRAWLYRILRRVISDHVRKHQRREELAGTTPLDDLPPGREARADDSPFDDMLARLSSERVQEALARLPEVYAEAVALHDLDGLLYREIAEVQDVPLGTVMSRIARGRSLLADLIIEHSEAWGLLPRPAADKKRPPANE